MKYIIFFFFAISLFACSNDTSNSTNTDIKQYADYYIRYLAGEKQLKAEAVFKKGTNPSKAIVSQPEGSIFLNQQKLKGLFMSKSNIRFQYEGTNQLGKDYVFRFVKDDNTKIDFDAGLNAITNFSIKGAASKSKGITINWEGGPLSEREELVVLITDEKNKAATQTFKASPNNSVSLGADKLTKLTTGKGFVYMVRKNFGEEKIQDLYIKSAAEYYTDKIDLDIVK